MRDLTPMAQYLIWAVAGHGVTTNQAIYGAVEKCAASTGASCHLVGRGRETIFVYHVRGYRSCKVTSSTEGCGFGAQSG